MPRVRFGLGALTVSREDAGWFAGAVSAMAVALLAFTQVASRRWQSFETNSFDLAFFDQIIFNTSGGRLFETSFVSYNFAGQHFEPILLAFVPAYWLGAGPYFLTISQAAVAVAAAVPLFFFARRLTNRPAIACAAVVAYLSNPYLHQSIAFDFHPEVMAAFPVFVAAWAVVAERRRMAIVVALSVLLFKEDTVFLALLLAGFMWSRGLKTEAKLTGGAAAGYALLVVLVLMPVIRGGESSDLVERYGYLFPGGLDAWLVRDVVLAPARAARVAFHPEQLWTVALFLAATSVCAFRRPWSLFWVVPGLGLALLSTHHQQRYLQLHYAAELVPALIILGVVGSQALAIRARPSLVAAAVGGPTLVALVFMNPLASANGTPPSMAHRAAVSEALAIVPADEGVSVSAQSGLLPRLSQRRQAHEFPGHAARADWIVIDRYGFRSSQSLSAGFESELETVRSTLELVYSRDGVEVFRRVP